MDKLTTNDGVAGNSLRQRVDEIKGSRKQFEDCELTTTLTLLDYITRLEAVAEALSQYFGYPSCPSCDSGVDDSDGLPCYCFDGTRLMNKAKAALKRAGYGDE